MSSPSQPAPPGSAPPPSGLSLLFRIFPSILLPMFLAMIDQTIVAAALPAIAADLGGAERVSWVVVGYLLATTIAAPVYGRLGDLLGRKPLMFVALGIFAVATTLCALSQSIEMLALSRVLQGIGGGGLMTLSQALIGETIPPRDRARYQGYLAAVAVVASTTGPIAGGFLTQAFGWRAVFVFGLPLAAVAAVLLFRLPARARAVEAFRFDLPGLFYLALFIVSTLLMLQDLQRFSMGLLPLILLLLAISIAAVVLLIRRERRATTPLLPLPLLRNPTIWRADALAFCHGGVLVSLITFLPIYLTVIHDSSPAEIGVTLLPLTVGIGLGAMATGQFVGRTGRTTIVPSIALIFAVILLVVLALSSPTLTIFGLVLMLGPISLLMGTVMGVVQVTVQAAAGTAMLGTAAASVQLSRSLGASLGTAVVGVALFSTLALTDPEAMQYFEAMLAHGSAALATLPPPRQVAIEAAFANAFRAAFLTTAGFAAAALILAWSIPMKRI